MATTAPAPVEMRLAAWRAAVYLNNLGVHLLERGGHNSQLSIATLTEAMTLTKLVLAAAAGTTMASGGDAGEFIILSQQQHRQILQRAHQRAAQLDHRSAGMVNSSLEDYVSIQAISNDTCPSMILAQELASRCCDEEVLPTRVTSAAAPEQESDSTRPSRRFTVVRIDWLDGADMEGDFEPDLEASIMLYNLAVAYQVLPRSWLSAKEEETMPMRRSSNEKLRLLLDCWIRRPTFWTRATWTVINGKVDVLVRLARCNLPYLLFTKLSSGRPRLIDDDPTLRVGRHYERASNKLELCPSYFHHLCM